MKRGLLKYLGISIMMLATITIATRIIINVARIINYLTEPLVILDAVLDTITFLALLIVPISVSKLLMEVDVPSTSLVEILIHVDILHLFGKLLIAISVMNLTYFVLKNTYRTGDVNQVVTGLVPWIFMLVVGIIIYIVANRLKREL